MKPPQRESATEIFHAALEMPEPARLEFLRDTCGSDPTLRSEVESLLAADAGAGTSFLDPARFHGPAVPQPDLILAAGDTVSGRFKIIRTLGDGGMGRVYEAYDSVLGVKMALKTLRQEVSSTPDILARFRQEVRIAHRITHTNICRTYHLDRDLRSTPGTPPVELTFLTMEYLEGETLQQLLRREGRLPLDYALAIARQLADAIDTAHTSGAIHRDIKPANIMICPAPTGNDHPRVVIMDFGLAKLTRDANSADLSSISQPGQAMGTLSYMSPEQLRGLPASDATDIYALGLVLYEMTTGVKTFRNCNTFQDAFRRVNQPPPSPRKELPSLPAAWETAITGCLQIHPAARSRTAHDVLRALEGGSASRVLTRIRRRLRQALLTSPRRKLAISSALVLAMSLSIATFRLMQLRTTQADAAVAPGTLVYLAPVSNRTGEKQLDNVTQLVEAGLSQSAHINLLDAGRVGDLLQQMARKADTAINAPTAREIAMRAGAARVIFPIITGTAPNYQLNVDIQQPDDNPSRYRERWTSTWHWQSIEHQPGTAVPEALQDTLRKASDWIRHTVGESQNDIARLDAPPADVTTTSWAALADYAHATELSRKGDAPAAVLALKSAVQSDPEFALAFARLGDIDFSLQRNNEGLDAYAKALATGADRRLSRRERDRIKAMVAVDTGDYQSADDALRDSISFYENDPLSWAYRVEPLKKLGHAEEALASLKKVLQFNPRNRFGLTELANTYMFFGHNEEAADTIEHIRALGLYPESVTELAGHLQFLQADYAGAEKSFFSLLKAKDDGVRLRAAPSLARVYAERGDFDKALAVLTQAIASGDAAAQPGERAALFLDRATILSNLGHVQPMLADVRQALSLDRGTRTLLTAAAVLGSGASNRPVRQIPVVSGTLRSILSMLPQRPAALDAQLARLRIQEALALIGNQWQSALDFARKAATLDAPAGQRDYLAAALMQAALHQPDAAVAKRMREEAAETYAIVALHPGYVWSHPAAAAPGAYSEQLAGYMDASPKVVLPPHALNPRAHANETSALPGYAK